MKFEGKIYGSEGGVIREVEVEAESADEAAQVLAEQWRDYPGAASVNVWSSDRKGGIARATIKDH